MPRPANYPKTVEDCLTFRLKSLTENNNTYFNSYGTRKGVTSWSIKGEVHSKINIEVTYTEYKSFIIFDYQCNGEPRQYKVEIICKPSNLGKGNIMFFVCPSTQKLCRKLYLHDGYFLHRTAFNNLMYQKQIESKKWRGLTQIFDKAFTPDRVYQERYKKYFKTHYKGKPTKRYLKLEQRIRIAENYPPGTIERLMMM